MERMVFMKQIQDTDWLQKMLILNNNIQYIEDNVLTNHNGKNKSRTVNFFEK